MHWPQLYVQLFCVSHYWLLVWIISNRSYESWLIIGHPFFLCLKLSHYVIIDDLPEYSCDYRLAENSTCRSYLPYTKTSASPHIQGLMNISTESLLAHLNDSECYDMAMMFVCAIRYPTCQEQSGFPLFPCRHICHSTHLIVILLMSAFNVAISRLFIARLNLVLSWVSLVYFLAWPLQLPFYYYYAYWFYYYCSCYNCS